MYCFTRPLLLLGCIFLLSACALSQDKGDGSNIRSLQQLSQQPPASRQLDSQSWQTNSGTDVIFMQISELPMLDVRLTFAAGSSRDGSTPGLANLANSMLATGTDKLDADAIAQAFEQLGANFSQSSARDMALVSLRTLSRPDLAQPAIELFTQVVAQPSFPEVALRRMKSQAHAGFIYEQQDPSSQINKAMFAKLYGQHPYASPTNGTNDSIKSISRQQLQDFHHSYYNASNGQLVIVGDLELAQAKIIAEQITSALPKGQAAAKLPAPQTPIASKQHIDFASSQTHILMAQLGVERGHPDYPALYLANQILGGSGFGSRLMEEVREKRGLTYGVYSSFSPMQVAGPFIISLQTKASQSQATTELVLSLVQEFITQGPSQAELDAAKREILGSFPLSTSSNSAISSQLANIAFYQLPHNWLQDFMQQIQQLELTQVNEAIKRHLDSHQLLVLTLGPEVAQQELPPPVQREAN